MANSNQMIIVKEKFTYPNGTVSTIEYNISATDWIRLRNSLEISRNLSNFNRVPQPTPVSRPAHIPTTAPIPRPTPAPIPVPVPIPIHINTPVPVPIPIHINTPVSTSIPIPVSRLNEQENGDDDDFDYSDMPPLEQPDTLTYILPPSNYNNENHYNLLDRPIFSHLSTSRLQSTYNRNIRHTTLRDIFPQLYHSPPEDLGLTQLEFASSITEQVISSSENYEDCSICKECINVGDNIIKLNACNHIFHKNCIEPWIFSSHRTNCPLCRTEIYV
jgi:hypothetical protein